ncbi:MAG TPA: glycosyltransferase family 39 protein [Candidatus Polarisedimenticolaceae bacterium]|nr:glycosyltransferase family 39 protein [Candidatus Polarisedimenticolaceae bacterium]
MESPRIPDRPPRDRWSERTAIAILVLAGWLTRLPALRAVALNPDESQYEATAAYLLASGASAFSMPHTSPATYTFYKLMARLFGPYPMFEVRIAVMLLVIATALWVYRAVCRGDGPWSGLAAGLIVVVWSVYFEGLTANREWFCNALLVLGALLFLGHFGRDDRRARLALFLSGVSCGAALGFKLHAGLLVLPLAIVCLWRSSYREQRPAALRALAWYIAGGLSITLLGLVPFAWEGTLGSYLRSIWTDLFGYAAAEAPRGTAGGTVTAPFYRGLPGRILLLAAYGFSALVMVGAWRRLVRRRAPAGPFPGEQVVDQWAVAYLAAALVSVSIGARFFGHYYLFLVPPVAVLVGRAIGWLSRPHGREAATMGAALAFLVLLVVDRAASWGGTADRSTWVYLALSVGLIAFGLSRPRRRLAPSVAAILAVEIALVGWGASGMLYPASAPGPGKRFARLSAVLGERSAAGDRLYVWGWAPEIYSLTRLTPSSQFVVSMYLVDDTRPEPTDSAIDRRYERMLMEELRSTPPRFIVDASRRSWTMVESGDPWLYDLDRYPGFELSGYLDRHYRAVGRFDGCVLYERRPQSG